MRAEFDKRALKSLARLKKSNPDIANKIAEKLQSLLENPDLPGALQMKGSGDEHFRVRVGNCRIIYRIENDVITIMNIGWRGSVYQEFNRQKRQRK